MRDVFSQHWDGKILASSVCISEPEVRSRLVDVTAAYVYILCRSSGEPFYVGKGGRNSRALDHVKEARNTKRLTHKLNVIRSMDRVGGAIKYVFEIDFSDEASALARERELIRLIGRHDLKLGPLTNQTDGGEGTSNPSQESRERRRATLSGDGAENEERRLANKWFKRIVDVDSVPVKNVGGYKIEGLWRNRASLNMSPRQAGALCASAIANRVLLQSGAVLPRRMIVDGNELIIENGVGRDTLSSEMTVLVDQTSGCESLKLTESGVEYIREHIDNNLLLDAGVISPNWA